MSPRLAVLALTPLLGACTEYDLGRDEKPTPPGDTGEPVVIDTGHEPPVETADTGEPPETEPPVDETGEPPDTDLPPEAARDPLYAQTAGTLYTVSPVDPWTRTKVGNFSGASDDITDIAIDAGGIMYAVSFTTLYRVDATNGRLTKVAKASASDLNALTFLSDGTLLAGGGASLYQVDTATGAFTRLSSIGSYTFDGDMVGLPDGLLYCAMTSGGGTQLVVYDMTTKSVVRSGNTGTGSLYGLGYAEDTLFGFSSDGTLYTLDPATGRGSRVSDGSQVWYGATTNPVAW